MKKRLTVMFIAVALTFSSVGVYAGSKLQEIKAYLNPDLNVRMDGQYVQLKDDNNIIVTPISYNGATYLPLRSVANLLHTGVDYEAATKTINLGLKVAGVPIIKEDYSGGVHSKQKDQTTYKGTDYKEVMYSNDYYTSGISLKPRKKYQRLYLQIAAIGNDIPVIKFKDFFNNNALLHTDSVSIQDGMKTIEVDISGVDTLDIDFLDSDGITLTQAGYVVPLTTSYYR